MRTADGVEAAFSELGGQEVTSREREKLKHRATPIKGLGQEVTRWCSPLPKLCLFALHISLAENALWARGVNLCTDICGWVAGQREKGKRRTTHVKGLGCGKAELGRHVESAR